MKEISRLIRTRRSVRTFDEKPVSYETIEKLFAMAKQFDNPYHHPVTFQLLDAKVHRLSCPVVVGAGLYVGIKLQKGPFFNEAAGYSFEALVLCAQSLGLGTVWIGGTFDRSAFEKAMELSDDEVMPCASPLGYPSAKMSLRESLMRKGVGADERLPFEKLFYDENFSVSLTKGRAGRLLEPLEMVRLSPSAVNRQPWRIVVVGSTAHFYLKRSMAGGMLDMQKMDLGIAMCHFDLSAKEAGLDPRFVIADPQLKPPDGLEYIASYFLSAK